MIISSSVRWNKSFLSMNSFFRIIVFIIIFSSFRIVFSKNPLYSRSLTSAGTKNIYAIEYVIERPDAFPAESDILVTVDIDGKQYVISRDYSIFSGATKKPVYLSGPASSPGLKRDIRKALFCARLYTDSMKVSSERVAEQGLSQKICSLVKCSAMTRPIYKGLADFIFQREKIFDNVVKKGFPVPEDVVRDFIIKRGRASLLDLAEYILEHPAYTLVLAANEYYSLGARALQNNIDIRKSAVSNKFIKIEDALDFLANARLIEYLWMSNRLMEALSHRISPVSPSHTRDLEETALMMDLAGFSVFETLGPPISVFEREIWEWDHWVEAPLHTEIDDYDWWSLTFDDSNRASLSRIRNTNSDSLVSISAKENKYGTIMRSSAQARDIWDAHRWTWDKKDWMRYSIDRTRMIRLRAAMMNHHYRKIKSDIAFLRTKMGGMSQNRFVASLEPILRESIRRLGLIRAYREFMDSSFRASQAQAQQAQIYHKASTRPVDPAYTTRGIQHLDRTCGRYSSLNKESMLGFDIELSQMIKQLDKKSREKLFKRADQFEKFRGIIENSLAENSVKIPDLKPGKAPEKNKKELFKMKKPDRKRDKLTDKLVIEQWNYSPIIDLKKALSEKRISLQVEPGGNLMSSHFLNLRIKKLKKEPFQLYIPAGTMVFSKHKFAQNLVIRTESPVPEEGYETGHLINLEDGVTKQRVFLPVFAFSHNRPLPDITTSMYISGEICSPDIQRIIDFHCQALINRQHLANVFASAGPLISLLDRKEILARPWIDLIAQLSIWAVTSGLNHEYMKTEAMAYADDKGLVKSFDQASAETTLISECVQAFLDASNSHDASNNRIDFFRPGIGHYPKVTLTKDLKGDNDIYCYEKAVNLFEQNRFLESQKVFKKILDSPSDKGLSKYDKFRIREWLMRCGFRRGKEIEALKVFSPEEINFMLNESPEVIRNFAAAQKGRDSYGVFSSQAMTLLEERWPETAFYYAEYLVAMGDYKNALSSFYRFIKLYNKRDDLHRLRIIRYDTNAQGAETKYSVEMDKYVKDVSGDYRFLSARAKTWIMLLAAALY